MNASQINSIWIKHKISAANGDYMREGGFIRAINEVTEALPQLKAEEMAEKIMLVVSGPLNDIFCHCESCNAAKAELKARIKAIIVANTTLGDVKVKENADPLRVSEV